MLRVVLDAGDTMVKRTEGILPLWAHVLVCVGKTVQELLLLSDLSLMVCPASLNPLL